MSVGFFLKRPAVVAVFSAVRNIERKSRRLLRPYNTSTVVENTCTMPERFESKTSAAIFNNGPERSANRG